MIMHRKYQFTYLNSVDRISFEFQFVQRKVFVPFPDQFRVVDLLSDPDQVVVQPSVRVIEISEFRDVSHSFMSHLQYWYTDCHIVGCSQIFSLVIFEILLFYQSQQLGVESPKMRSQKISLSITIFIHNLSFKWSRKPNVSDKGHKVTVSKPAIFNLKLTVKQFEHLPADELVVPIDDHKNLIGFTILQSCLSDIRHGPSLLLIVIHHNIQNFTSFSPFCFDQFHVLINQHSCFVSGRIINNNDMVVRIVLLHNGIYVILVPFLIFVVKCGYNYAEGQLLTVLTNFVDFMIIFVFLLREWSGLPGRSSCQCFVLFGGGDFLLTDTSE